MKRKLGYFMLVLPFILLEIILILGAIVGDKMALAMAIWIPSIPLILFYHDFTNKLINK